MGNAIVVKDLVKVFGDIQALKDCSFSVREGEVFGLIGPNGAGKTTALRIVATLLKPTSGSIDDRSYDYPKRQVGRLHPCRYSGCHCVHDWLRFLYGFGF